MMLTMMKYQYACQFASIICARRKNKYWGSKDRRICK